MLLSRYRLRGLLALTQLSHTFVLLTANIDDVKNLARKFVSAPMADKIADFLAKASSYSNAAISDENEQNAEDDIRLFQSDQEHFDRAARQGSSKRYSLETRTTSDFQAKEDTVSIERTTENVRTKPTKNLKVEIDKWQQIKKIPQHKAMKQKWQREEIENISRAELPPVKPQRLQEKHQYWQQGMDKEEEVHPRPKDEKVWQKRQENDWRERFQEPTELPIPNPNKKRYELKEASKMQEKRLIENRQKFSNVGKKRKHNNYWPQFISKTTAAPKPDRIYFEKKQQEENNNNNPNNYEEQTPETKLKFDEGNQDNEMTAPSTAGYEERIMEEQAKRQRKRTQNRERFPLMNNVETTPPPTIVTDLLKRLNGFNIDHLKETGKKERNEFNQYNDLKYKNMQYIPRSQLAATSGNVLLPKLEKDRNEAQMPKAPLKLPKIEPQSWWDQEKEKVGDNIEDKNINS